MTTTCCSLSTGKLSGDVPTGKLSGDVPTGGEWESSAALWQALAACMVQRMDILHERLLHMTCSCPEAAPALCSDSLAASTEPAAAAAAKKAGEAQANRVSADIMLKEQATDELNALTGALLGIFNLDEELRSAGGPGIPCIGQLAKQSFSKMLIYAQQPGERLCFLTMLQKAAAAREQAYAEILAQQTKQRNSSGTGLQRPAAASQAGAAQHETLSLAAAAQQLLKGSELWQEPQVAQSLQAAVDTLLHGPARDLGLLFTADEAAISAQKLQESITRRSPAKENGNKHDRAAYGMQETGHMSTGMRASAKNLIANKCMQSDARSACGPQQAQCAADSLKLDEGTMAAAAAAEVFVLLNRMPLQWPALHEPAARHLLGLSLGFHKLVLRALEAARTQSEASRAAAGTGSEPTPAMQTFASSATALLGSILSFIAQLAASGSKGLADDLACVSADSGLDWPYLAADAAAREFPVALPGTPPGPQAVQAQGPDAELVSQAAAAIMYHSSRHALISHCSPAERATDDGAVQALEAWKEGARHSLQPGRPAWQLGSSQPQQLEVVCGALRSAAALAMPSTSAPAHGSSKDASAGAPATPLVAVAYYTSISCST